MTHAENWAYDINHAYDVDYGYEHGLSDDEIVRTLTKAAKCLRDGATHSFTGEELDIVRHVMPAHIVHQSGVYAFLGQVYGAWKKGAP